MDGTDARCGLRRAGRADLKVGAYVPDQTWRPESATFRGADLQVGPRNRWHRVQVANRDGERIRRIVRRRWPCQAEQQLHHLLHLLLFGAPVPDDGALDFRWGVLDHRTSRLDGGKNSDATRMSELERAAHVGCVETALRSRRNPAMQPLKSRPSSRWMRARRLGKWVGRQRRDRAAHDQTRDTAVRLHATVTGAFGARIDAEHSHAREASISFSSTSKLAQTCCTSSWSSMASISFSICCASLPTSLM